MTKMILKHSQEPNLDLAHKLPMTFERATDAQIKKALNSDSIPEGYVAGWASTPDLDTYHHVVQTGAFDQAIKERGLFGPRGIKLLSYHDWQKVSGVIKVLETRSKRLWIEAQMNLKITYARDAYEAMLSSGAWNFSVGFQLKDWSYKEDPNGNEYLSIERGDLYEISIVPFPGNEDCTMEFIKSRFPVTKTSDDSETPKTMSEFEKMLVTKGLAVSRDVAHQIALAVKSCGQLFAKGQGTSPAEQLDPPVAPPVLEEAHVKSIQEKLDAMRKILAS